MAPTSTGCMYWQGDSWRVRGLPPPPSNPDGKALSEHMAELGLGDVVEHVPGFIVALNLPGVYGLFLISDQISDKEHLTQLGF